MLKRSFASKDRAGKATKLSKASKRSFRDDVKRRMLEENLGSPSSVGEGSPVLTSAIITLVVGPDQRLFAAHEDVLCHSPFFAEALRSQFFDQPNARRITLPDDEPEAFSCVLEYLYKGDYYPRLLHDKKRNSWYLEDSLTGTPNPGASPASLKSNGGRAAAVQPTMYHSGVADVVLRDTVVYCAADRLGLEELKRLALRKQGLQAGIEVGTILRSARFAYANTPDNDSRLRAHYLALIIRSRRTFKRSGTMQMEMEMGGRLFFDLFVAMCNHMDDLAEMGGEAAAKSPAGR